MIDHSQTGVLEEMLNAIRSLEQSHRTMFNIMQRQGDRIRSLESVKDETIPYLRSVLVDVLINHQRTSMGECMCGWSELGCSHAVHVADMYEQTAVEWSNEQRYLP